MLSNRLNHTSIVTILFLCVSFFSLAQNKLEIPPQITIGKLSNGLTYYFVPEGDNGKVRVTLLSNTGALAETPEQHGYAHFLEHMMFNGSKNYSGKSVTHVFEDMGMRIGKEYFANTSLLSTQYDLFVPENNLEYMRKCLLIYKDWIQDLDLDKAVLENEKKVVIEEINLGGGGSNASPFMIGTKMEDHDALGDNKAVHSVAVEKLREFYKKYYTPDQLAVIICGKIDKDKTKQLIEEIFSQIPAPTYKVTNKYPNLTKETIVSGNYSHKELVKETSLTIASKRAPLIIDNYENLKQSFINRLFAEMLERRFEQVPAGNIGQSNVNIVTLMPGNQLTNIRLKSSKKTSYKQMLDDFCLVLAQIKQYGFLEQEIKQYANGILAKAEKQKNEVTLSFQAAQKHFLSGGDVSLTGQENYNYMLQIVKELQPADFVAVVNNLIQDHKTIFFDATSTAFSPDFTREYILQKLDAVSKMKVNSYEFKKPSVMPKLASQPSFETVSIDPKTPVKIEKRTQLADNLTVLKYKNGMSVILNNSPREHTIIKAVNTENLNAIPSGDREYFKNTLNFVDGGYGKYTSKEISALEMAFGIAKKASLTDNYLEYKVSGLPNQFDQIIKIFNLYITSAYQQDEVVFNRKLQSYLKAKAKAENDSTAVDQNYLAAISSPKDSIDIATASKRFFNYNQKLKKKLSSSLIYIVGALPANVEELVSKYIATIPVVHEQPTKSEGSLPPNFETGIIKKEESWKRRGCMVLHIFNRIPEKPITFKDELILDAIAQFSNIKMLQVIREKYGLVYSTGTTGIAKKEPYELYTLSVRYMVNPINVEQSSQLLEDEVLTPMSQGQISDREVKQLKAILKTTYITSFFDENQIEEEWLKRNIKYGILLTPELIEKTINSITAEEIKKRMKEVVDMNNYHYTIRKYEKTTN